MFETLFVGTLYNFEIIDQVFQKVVDKHCSINYTSSNQVKMHLDICFSSSLPGSSTKKVLDDFIGITLFHDCSPAKLLYDSTNRRRGVFCEKHILKFLIRHLKECISLINLQANKACYY